jgi:hypothetical protein
LLRLLVLMRRNKSDVVVILLVLLDGVLQIQLSWRTGRTKDEIIG